MADLVQGISPYSDDMPWSWSCHDRDGRQIRPEVTSPIRIFLIILSLLRSSYGQFEVANGDEDGKVEGEGGSNEEGEYEAG